MSIKELNTKELNTKEMRITGYLKKGIFALSAALLLTACSTEEGQFNPEEIVAQAVAESKHFSNYYSEAKLISEMDGEREEILLREWRDQEQDRVRVETESLTNDEKAITVMNQGKMLIYTVGEDLAYEMDFEQGALPSQREQILQSLKSVQERSTVEVVGEEKLLERDVYHLKAIPKQEKSFLGVEEYWIDQKNWFVLKSVTSFNDGSQVELTVTKIDFDPEWEEHIFTIDFAGKDVEIKNMDELELSQDITIEEAVEILGQPFAQIVDESYTIASIETFGLKEEKHREVNIEYYKDGLPQFTVSMFSSNEDEKDFDELFEMLGESEKIALRGTQALYVDSDFVSFLSWDEDGLHYMFTIENPKISLDDLKALVENMQNVN